MQNIAGAIEKAANAVLFIIKITASGLLIVSVVVIVVNAFGRYLFDAPIRAAEELMRYALTAIVFLGAILVTWDDRHLKMDLLANMLGRTGRTVVNVIGVVCFIFACLYTAWYSFAVVEILGDGLSLIAEIPMYIPHGIMPVGLTLIAVAVLLRIGTYVRGDGGVQHELDTLPKIESEQIGDGGGAGAPRRDGRA